MSDFIGGKVHLVVSGDIIKTHDVGPTPTDIGLIASKGIYIVPSFSANTLSAYNIPDFEN